MLRGRILRNVYESNIKVQNIHVTIVLAFWCQTRKFDRFQLRSASPMASFFCFDLLSENGVFLTVRNKGNGKVTDMKKNAVTILSRDYHG